ncbi:Bifunctional aspartokinase/homoserine dehydrogenase [Dorcoceras hygrometricum]|uniref:Bifunctional aspartokinase/homoserine dehydrogenase n=1 Tax=Dorcoceras hygrometricum TaxID=472368 RepID=A0A2Z7DF81_9LAMI|nr:Bifunctional aspartokinase/homoserine dehydrogenase [Dorcoceras hygrometricum]
MRKNPRAGFCEKFDELDVNLVEEEQMSRVYSISLHRTQGTTLSEAFTTATDLCPTDRGYIKSRSKQHHVSGVLERKQNTSADVQPKQRVVLVTSLHTHVTADVQAGRAPRCELVYMR